MIKKRRKEKELMSANTIQPEESSVKKHIPLLVVLMLGLFLAILNQTLLNVAIPHLITEFGVTANTAQWLLTGYMLVNGALIPLSAYLIERFGVRRLFLFAMACFTIGALVCRCAYFLDYANRTSGSSSRRRSASTSSYDHYRIYFPSSYALGKGMGIFGLAMMFAPAIGPNAFRMGYSEL